MSISVTAPTVSVVSAWSSEGRAAREQHKVDQFNGKVNDLIDRFNVQLTLLFSQFLVLATAFERYRLFGAPEFRCYLCRKHVQLPVMLKTECSCPVFFCRGCMTRSPRNCPTCYKATIQGLCEEQRMLEDFNDHQPQSRRFLDSKCRRCDVECESQKALRSHRCGTSIDYGSSSCVVADEFKSPCVICFNTISVPVRHESDFCDCRYYCCLDCIRDAISKGHDSCFMCRKHFIYGSVSRKYCKQRGMILLDDWHHRMGGHRYLSTECGRCGETFGSSMELLNHKLTICREGTTRCDRCRLEMKRKDLEIHMRRC